MPEPTKKQKTVLLLNPFTGTIKDVDYYLDENKKDKKLLDLNGHLYAETPLGLTYVYTWAKSQLPEAQFHIIDAMAQLVENLPLGMETNFRHLMKRIMDINPDVIGIGAYYFKSAGLFHETCQRIKKKLPNTVIVAGGNYPTDLPEMVLKDKNIDYILKSEGELAFTRFLIHYFKGEDVKTIDGIGYRDKTGLIHINPKSIYIDDLSRMPIPDRSPLPMHIYGQGRNALDRLYTNYKALGMTVSRGCPFVCTFCTATNFWNRKIRYRSTKDVLDEMQILKEEYGADTIIIDDDNFLINKKRVTEILNGMIKRKLNLRWICGGGSNARILEEDDDFLDLVIRSGYCYFNLAIESASNDTLKRIKKPLRVEQSVSLIKKIRARYPQMYINAYFMVGFPFEKKTDIINTLEFSADLELDWASHYIFKPYPNTALFDYCVKHHYIKQFDIDFGELFKPSNLDGEDWTSQWLFETNYLYNLKINFLNNRNIKYDNFNQALRDFEYIIDITRDHALAYRQAALVSEKTADAAKAAFYSKKEKKVLSGKDNEFKRWYKKLMIPVPGIS